MSRRETKFYLKAIIITLFFVLILGYSVFELWNYATGPEITISEPINGLSVSESLITVAGQAKNIKDISLDDRPIVIDEKGNFSEKLLLSYGYNIITLKAQDRFGKKTEQKLQILYK